MRPIEPFGALRFTRRQLLQVLLPLAAWLPAPMLLAAASGDTKPAAKSFAIFLDLLLPADKFSPSASEIGVDAAILEQAQQDRQLGRLIELGVGWLDDSARSEGASAFHALPEERQLLILRIAEQQRKRTLPRVFFDNLRHQAVGHYYADARSWPSLGYAGPPQPKGFMDYQQPLVIGEKR